MSLRNWARASLADVLAKPGDSAGKGAWRDWSRRARAGLDLAAIAGPVVQGLVAWQPLRDAQTALLYLPLADEVDITPLQQQFPGTSFVATRTPARGGVLSIHRLEEPLETHPYGFLQPREAAQMVAPSAVDVWLLPGLAFDRHGTRLGRGAGYFDELVGRAPGSIQVGVSPQACVVERLPHEPHDRPVHFLATEDGTTPVVS